MEEADKKFADQEIEHAKARSDIRVLQRTCREQAEKINLLCLKMEILDKFIAGHANDMLAITSEINTIKDIIGRKAFKKNSR